MYIRFIINKACHSYSCAQNSTDNWRKKEKEKKKSTIIITDIQK